MPLADLLGMLSGDNPIGLVPPRPAYGGYQFGPPQGAPQGSGVVMETPPDVYAALKAGQGSQAMPQAASAMPAAMPKPQGHGLFSGGLGADSPLRNLLGAIADALSVSQGRQPYYHQELQQRRSRSAVGKYLGDVDPELAGLLGSGLDSETALGLYKIRHPASEVPAGLKEFLYYQRLQGGDRTAFENFLKLTHPGMMAPVTLGANDTIEGGGVPSDDGIPSVSDEAGYNALPSGAKFRDPQGNVRTKGGQTAQPSGGFSVTARNNNPGALRVPGSKRFQRFGSEREGVQAQEALLGRYFNRGLNNVSRIVETYAPRKSRGGDNTDEQVNNYIGYVSRRLNVNPQDTLSPVMLSRIGQAMREFETGQRTD